MNSPLFIAVPLLAAAICAAFIVILRPLLVRYALARPNARSSHTEPTPQGGGLAVIIATIVAAYLAVYLFGIASTGLLTLFAATAVIACVGAVDDLQPIPVMPRLLLQTAVVGTVLLLLPASTRLFPVVPIWLEQAVLILAGLWFVNLVNFMDGIDWITAAEVVPVTAALAIFGLSGHLNGNATLVAIALGGAMLGFVPFNKPVAKLFLGDVGSLPIGLLLGWCLLQLAGAGHFAAALILPLYYLADATITLLRRLAKGEAVWVAHRSHFYQQATTNGFSVMQVVTEIFVLNVVLAILAAASTTFKSGLVSAVAFATAATATAFLLYRFSRIRV
jgi:UDP-N-acetylmuramyl pentapeptide phosphotransferase/UDP-N-acetylglucosamine-1-phosphate transferase